MRNTRNVSFQCSSILWCRYIFCKKCKTLSIATNDDVKYFRYGVNDPTLFKIVNTIDPGVDLMEAYKRGTDADQKFIANLAQFLGTFLKEHSQYVEVIDVNENNSDLKKAHEMVCLFVERTKFSDY